MEVTHLNCYVIYDHLFVFVCLFFLTFLFICLGDTGYPPIVYRSIYTVEGRLYLIVLGLSEG